MNIPIQWVSNGNSPRILEQPTSGSEVTTFDFVPPNTPGALRAFIASEYGPGQVVSRVVTLKDGSGKVITTVTGNTPTFTVVVGKTESGRGWYHYGVNPGETYTVEHRLENTDYSPPLDFYVDFNNVVDAKHPSK